MRNALLWYALPITLLCGFVVILLLTVDRVVIFGVAPKQFSPGAELTVSGIGFGNQRDSSRVLINGTPLTQGEYVHWSDNKVVIRVPTGLHNGALVIEGYNGLSNEALITGSTYVAPATEQDASSEIQITSHSPLNPAGGDVVVFNGIFGGYEHLRLYITARVSEPATPSSIDFIWQPGEAMVHELTHDEFIQRSLHRIAVRLPSGIRSGNVIIENHHGTRKSYFLDIDSRLGTMRHAAPRRHMINYGAHIENEVGQSYAVWLPLVPRTPAQPQQALLFASEQLQYAVEDTGYFLIDHRTTYTPVSLRMSLLVLRAEQHSVIHAGLLNPSPDIDQYGLERYLDDSPWLAVESDEARSAVKGFLTIPNFYLRAQAMYRYLLARLSPRPYERRYTSYIGDADSELIDPDHIRQLLRTLSITEETGAHAVEYALLTATLLRAAGIPSRVITGAYADVESDGGELETVIHYWNEFFLPKFGWVPLDSAMGDGMYDAEIAEAEGEMAQEFYFGSLDNARVALSNDIYTIPQYYKTNTLHEFDRSYVLFTHHIETEKDVDSSEFYLHPITLLQ